MSSIWSVIVVLLRFTLLCIVARKVRKKWQLQEMSFIERAKWPKQYWNCHNPFAIVLCLAFFRQTYMHFDINNFRGEKSENWIAKIRRGYWEFQKRVSAFCKLDFGSKNPSKLKKVLRNAKNPSNFKYCPANSQGVFSSQGESSQHVWMHKWTFDFNNTQKRSHSIGFRPKMKRHNQTGGKKEIRKKWERAKSNKLREN